MIKERRPDYWGMPAHEWVLCDCFEDNQAPYEGCLCEVGE